MTLKARLFADGKMNVANEIVELPSELKGGRNLVMKSDMNSLSGWANNGSSTIAMDGGFIKNTWTAEVSTPGIRHVPKITLPVGTYTFTVMVNMDGMSADKILSFYLLSGTGPTVNVPIPRKSGMALSTVTFTLTEPVANKDLYLLTVNPKLGEFVLYDWMKLEKGLVATQWSLSPEDLGYTLPNWIQNFDNPVQFHNDGIATKELVEIPSGLTGNRNLFKGHVRNTEIKLNDYQGKGSFTQFMTNLTFEPVDFLNMLFTISFYAKSPNGATPLKLYNQNNAPRYFYYSTDLDASLGTDWKFYSYTFTNLDRGSIVDGKATTISNKVEIYAPNAMGVLIKNLKVELGRTSTAWTPAPEDLGHSIPLWVQNFSKPVQYHKSGIAIKELTEGVTF